MGNQENLQLVQDIYAALGRGDHSAMLDQLADNADWDYAYRVAPSPVPWLQPRSGKEEVAGFFKSLQDNLEIHKFAVNALAVGPGVVVALFEIEATVKHTGRRIVEQNEAHIWHFDEAGKVVRFRHCADTYQHVMAYRG